MVGDEAGDCIMEGFTDHAIDLSFISVDLGELLKLFYTLKLHGQICDFK